MNEFYKRRQRTLILLVSIVMLVLLGRLFYIQVWDTSYQNLADNNAVRREIIYPTRGIIYDRNNALLVNNVPVYDINVIPAKTTAIDTAKFCNLLDIRVEDFREKLKKAIQYSRYKSSIFLSNVPPDQYAQIQEYLYQFPGFFSRVRTVRSYPFESAANILGYMSEVDPNILDTTTYYQSGDYIGITGVERSYENILRGIKGEQFLIVDVLNREKGVFKNGSFNKAVQAGKDLQLTLDIDLQQYGEKLMKNKKGAIVVLDPRNGEILAMVSSPSYNPNLLSGRERSNYYAMLQRDPQKPLFNRATMAQYPPGSTVKPLVGLIALEENIIPENFYYPCNRTYRINKLTLHCSHSHYSARNIQEGIKESCNPYFWQIFRNTIDNLDDTPAKSLDKWISYFREVGFGHLSVDLPHVDGFLPSAAYYDKIYKNNRWGSTTIISLGIGQGEFAFTPLELANYVSVLANRGFYYPPHIVKNHETIYGKKDIYDQKMRLDFNIMNMIPIIDGMEKVVRENYLGIYEQSLNICGKTGTAQNPGGKDHSLFIGFAPKDNPKVAVVAVVENAGFGYEYAAPIADLMIEKCLNDSINIGRTWVEERLLRTNLNDKDE
ncbi:MAG: penicillin-binding protein 2 [Chitinophagales bacterium]|nr:penicillin-binding protein 2 [Bacteroidota bacterium]MCB9043664.1 penicillin-binding protein 2 [Chitinophagales bacterium]